LEAAGRVVIGLDLPGHGASKDLTDRDPVDLLFEEAAKHGSVDAIGFSAGSWALLAAAAERPTLFHRVAVLGAGDNVLTQSMHTAAMQQPMIDALRSTEEPKDNPMAAVIFALITDAGNDPNAVADYLAADKRFPGLEDLARNTAPTLAVDGSDDPAGLSEVVTQTIPNSTRLTIAGAGHFDIPTDAEAKTAVITFINEANQ
jgi:pimeloyl-ACP methyl ester carboxylesterase